MRRRMPLVAAALAGAFATALVMAAVGADAAGRIDDLPRSIGEPECGPERAIGILHIDYVHGSGYGTPEEALLAAIGTERDATSAANFWRRAVRLHEELAYDFVLVGLNGDIDAATTAYRSDGGWLVSTVYRCDPPYPADVGA